LGNQNVCACVHTCVYRTFDLSENYKLNKNNTPENEGNRI
jgi:hypothetical protein